MAEVLGRSGSTALGTRFVTRGYTFFTNPSAASLLKILGSDEEEQIRTLTDLLRNSSEEEINDLMSRLTQAISHLAEERERAAPGARRPDPDRCPPARNAAERGARARPERRHPSRWTERKWSGSSTMKRASAGTSVLCGASDMTWSFRPSRRSSRVRNSTGTSSGTGAR